MSAEAALLAALRTTMLADAGTKAVLGDPPRIYDDPPEDVQFPYVTVGRIESRQADAAMAPSLEHGVTLHVWSRYGGRAEALDVIAALRSALHEASPEVSGRRLVFLFAQFSDVFRSGDGRTTHGVLRLRALTEPL
ncbi:MAG: DUF3168 domain-containing protein [Hyphomonadaceae bacterium]|nr:DUF3168 domain-containing protein [Hyphomonadaceae bacterium]